MNPDASSAVDLVLQPRLQARVATNDPLDVRSYHVRESMSELFKVTLFVHSTNQSIDFDAVIGKPASVSIQVTELVTRTLTGVCTHIHQVETGPVEKSPLKTDKVVATYQVMIMPKLWFATQRRNYRMFQQMSDPDIVLLLLAEWGVKFEIEYDRKAYKKRKYRVQYAETDYAFMSRLLEDAGIAFYFDERGVLILTDIAEAAEPRDPIFYNDQIAGHNRTRYISDTNIGQRVSAGAYTIRDHDYRRSPSFVLEGEASPKPSPKAGANDNAQGGKTGADAEKEAADALAKKLERYHYIPGAFLFESDNQDPTPSADDKGKARHDPEEGTKIAKRRLEAKTGAARFLVFQTTVLDLRVGHVFRVPNHPHAMLAAAVLVTETQLSGTSESECHLQCEATSTVTPFRPPLTTPKPRVMGVESATVVGPSGEEIHTDEFGRVRVHFHWDRESKRDDNSSCWIHVSQPWAGAHYGAINIPRVGQEVIVDFLGGDPDRPVILGRVYTNLQKPPYTLPANKTKSGWQSRSTPGGGGYNEIMFEDAKGKELLSMQAERDMATLVKHDQSLHVRRHRNKKVDANETTTIGENRNETVGKDEQIGIGKNRSVSVGGHESLDVGASRSRNVGASETVNIGGSRTRTVAIDDTLFVGGIVTRTYSNRWSTVRGDSISTVGHDVTETILHDRFRSVGNDETFAVGKNLAGSVAGSSMMKIDQDSTTVVGASAARSVGGHDALTVSENQSIEVGGAQSLVVGAELAVEVGASASEVVAAAKSTVVGAACSLAVAGASLETIGAASIENVGTVKSVTARDAIQLTAGTEPNPEPDPGIALLQMQSTGEILLGATSFELPHATIKVEGVGAERGITISFGASKLTLRQDGVISLTGTTLLFNGAGVG